MIERLNSIKQEILDGIEKHANSRATAFELRKQFLDSKTGKIGQLMKEMKNIAPEERANFGKSVNELKDWASSVSRAHYCDFKNSKNGFCLVCGARIIYVE